MFARVRYLLVLTKDIKRRKIWGRTYFGPSEDLDWIASFSAEVERTATEGFTYILKDGTKKTHRAYNAEMMVEMGKDRK